MSPAARATAEVGVPVVDPAFAADVAAGLSASPKTLPSRWLYDEAGSELFEHITDLPEYYPTRTETAILAACSGEIAGFVGPEAVVIEYGSGASRKTEILLAALARPAAYVPMDISAEMLAAAAARVAARFPAIPTRPVLGDFMDEFDLPPTLPEAGRVGFFPGSTIGNLAAAEAVGFLDRMRRHVGREGKAVVGFDLVKSPAVLVPAYDDAAGVTAAFNRNILRRINRELGGTFDPDAFAHEARWNEAESRIEMHLVARTRQRVRVGARSFAFEAGESIHTENSRKYTVDGFRGLAERASWRLDRLWTDPAALFAVAALSAAG